MRKAPMALGVIQNGAAKASACTPVTTAIPAISLAGLSFSSDIFLGNVLKSQIYLLPRGPKVGISLSYLSSLIFVFLAYLIKCGTESIFYRFSDIAAKADPTFY
jgi:hypothetical protein